MSSAYDVAIIGGGHNGLTTACLLAQAGRKVVIFERRPQLGGLAGSEEFSPGYHSSGILHDSSGVRPQVIEQLRLESYGLRYDSEPRPVLIPREDGRSLLLWSDPERSAAEISAHSQRDAKTYHQYRAFLQRIAPILQRVFTRPPPNLADLGLKEALRLGSQAIGLRLLGKSDMMELLRIVPMAVADWLGEQFETPLLQAALAAPALHHTFTGPRSPGNSLNLLLSETLSSRPLAGGPPALVVALEKAARALGAEIRADEAVEEVRIENGVVKGVVLADGENVPARVIAASCHPRHLFLDLLSPRHLAIEFEQNIINFRSRGTCAKVHLALSSYPEFPSHPNYTAARIRIGGSLDELERAFDPVKYGEMSERPILEISVPTVTNPETAPTGHHVFSILVHFVPFDLRSGWTDISRQLLLDRVVSRVEEVAPGFTDLVVDAQVLTPFDLEVEYGVTGGHLLHGEPAIDQLIQRPVPECAGYASPIDGLYLCGSGAHPGGGITCAPGALAAAKILRRRTGR
ncbi:MAG: NAD(P)/FAD-dependent oxidoreductase [Thermoanaerobaculia bacterium]